MVERNIDKLDGFDGWARDGGDGGDGGGSGTGSGVHDGSLLGGGQGRFPGTGHRDALTRRPSVVEQAPPQVAQPARQAGQTEGSGARPPGQHSVGRRTGQGAPRLV